MQLPSNVTNATAYWEYQNENDLCTIDTCPLDYAFLTYIPNLPGNVVYAGLFGLLLASQLVLGCYYRTWAYTFSVVSGLLLEVVGYVGRVLLHNDPFSNGNFLMYIICLTIGPAFLSAAIYLCLARVVVVYGPHLSRVSPRTYTITFITSDVVALVLQASGGALADTMDDSTMGTNIMVAGLAWQVFSMIVFVGLCLDFARTARKNRNSWGFVHANVRASRSFKVFLIGMTTATFGIMIRSCFRAAELSDGFDGKLANDEITFMILEGAIISIASIAMTVCHPGPAFRDAWTTASFNLRKRQVAKASNDGSSLELKGKH